MAQHHPQLLRQLQKWVVSLLLLQTDCTTGGEASLLESNPDQNIIDCNPPQFYFLSACDRDKSDWLQGASCESWLGWRVTTSDLRTGLWLRFRVTAQSGGTHSSHNLSHPEAAGNPQSSQRDRVDIIISFLLWIQAIKDEFRRMRARDLSSFIQSEARNLATPYLLHVTGGMCSFWK